MQYYGYYFTFRALTAAQRGACCLQQAGVPASLVRSPSVLAAQGCGYSLEVAPVYAARAADALFSCGVGYGGVYQRLPDGMVREAAL